jgi:gliding motility-associated-like protein
VLGLCWGNARAQVVRVSASVTYPDTVCVGAPINLVNTSTGGTTYNWNFCGHYTDTLGNSIMGCPAGESIPGSTQFTPPAFSYSFPGTYAFCLTLDTTLVTQTQNCYNIVVKSAPTIAFGNDTIFCNGQSVVLNAPDSPGVKNDWSTGSTADSIIVNNSGVYTLTSQYYGCTVDQIMVATSLANPVITLPRDTVFCDSGVLKYSTTQPATFIWNTGSRLDSTVVKSNGLYWLQLNERGCTALDSITCKVIPTHLAILGKDSSFCGPGRLAYVDMDTTQVTYQWSTGSDSTSTPVPTSGMYWLELTDNGCVNRDTIQCTVISQPSLTLPADTLFCDSGRLNYTSALPVTYQWSDGSDSSATHITTSGLYKLTLNNAGCLASDSTQVTVSQIPKIVLPKDTTFCGPGSLSYTSALPVTYTWSSGVQSPTAGIPASGLYWLQLDNQGCMARDSVQATVIPLPVSMLKDTGICFSGPYVLDAGNPGDTYQWQDGSTAETYTVTQPGEYSVTVNNLGCSLTETARIIAVGVPDFSLGGNQSICPGESIELRPGVDTLNFSWQNGSEDSVLIVSAPGTYFVTGSNSCGSHTDSVVVAEGVCVVHVPSAFTPNGDGKNDLFKVLGLEVVDEFNLQIFNRWGQEVFKTEDTEQGWDGTVGGKNQPVGVYMYTVHFRYRLTGKSYSLNGTVALIR